MHQGHVGQGAELDLNLGHLALSPVLTHQAQEILAILPSPSLTQPHSSCSQNVTANHRINDAVANEDGPQVLTGRFMYGPLDMVTLTGEKVRTWRGCRSPCLASRWLGSGGWGGQAPSPS